MPKPDNDHSPQISRLLRQAEPPRSPRQIDEGIQNLAREQASHNRAAFNGAQGASWFSQPLTRAVVALSMAGIALSITLRQPQEERLTQDSGFNESLQAAPLQGLLAESLETAQSDTAADGAQQQFTATAAQAQVVNIDDSTLTTAATPVSEPALAARRSAPVAVGLPSATPATASAVELAQARGAQADSFAVAGSAEGNIRLLEMLEGFFEPDARVELAPSDAASNSITPPSQRQQALLERYDLAADKLALQERFAQDADLRQEYDELQFSNELALVIERLRNMTFR